MKDRRLFYKLSLAQHLLSKRMDLELDRTIGVRSVQLGAVFFLLKHDGCMLKELSAGLGLNNSAITTLVSRMEEAGLLKKTACSVDGRSYRLFLTEKAKTLGQKALPLAKKFNAELCNGFSDEEIETVIRFLDSIMSIAKEKNK